MWDGTVSAVRNVTTLLGSDSHCKIIYQKIKWKRKHQQGYELVNKKAIKLRVEFIYQGNHYSFLSFIDLFVFIIETYKVYWCCLIHKCNSLHDNSHLCPYLPVLDIKTIKKPNKLSVLNDTYTKRHLPRLPRKIILFWNSYTI